MLRADVDTTLAWKTPGFYATSTDCPGPLSGVSWLLTPAVGGRQGMAVLRSEIYRGWAHSTLSVLSGGTFLSSHFFHIVFINERCRWGKNFLCYL